MTFEASEPAGIALHVCIQQRKPKLVQPCLCCILGVSVEQVAERAAVFCFRKSYFTPGESLEHPNISVLGVMLEKGLEGKAA